MSRRLALAFWGIALLAARPAAAQTDRNAPDAPAAAAQGEGPAGTTKGAVNGTADGATTAEAAIARAQARYGPPDRRCRSPDAGDGSAVVVCGRIDDARFRVPSSATLDPTGAGVGDDGLRAPDVFGIGNVGPVVARGCFIPPCPPPAAFVIDLAAIPEAPAGSDADRIARGEVRAR